MKDKKYTEIREEIFQAEENSRKLGYKVWIILFASSFLIYLWSSSMVKFLDSSSFVLLPIILNSFTWILWFSVNYLSFLRPLKSSYNREFRSFKNILDENKYAYKKWEYQKYKLNRQLKYVRIIELLVSLQIALIPLLWAFSLLRF